MERQIFILSILFFYFSSTHTAASEMPSSSSSSRSQSKLDQLLIVNQLEIDRLSEKYKRPIVVKGVLGINKVRLTKASLNHVFGMHIKQKNRTLKSPHLSGFHHDYNLELEDLIKPFYSSGGSIAPGVREAFISYSSNQLPVFKTFFSPMLTREQVLEMLIESLHNIQTYENEGKNIKIRGKATIISGKNKGRNLLIDTLVNKRTHEIVTFFPVPQKPKEETQHEQERVHLLFKKHFNFVKKPEREPVTDEEITELASLYAEGIPVDWVIVGNNVLFKESFSEEALADLDPLNNQPPKHIKKINITVKSLENVFAQNNDGAFPKYLSRKEILAQLKDVLEGITIYKAGSSLRAKDLRVGPFQGIGNFIKLRGFTKGKDIKDIWELFIIINEDTNDLEIFYPLFS